MIDDGDSLTIAELTEAVSDALASGYGGQSSGRVREVPNLRTIRYYTTLGLLDRPAEMRGRTAYYGRRHLQQLVAIKRLQAEGLSLREIQSRLLAIDDGGLERIAGLKASETSRPAARRAFWKERAAAAPAAPAPAPAMEQASRAAGAPPRQMTLRHQISITLAKGVTLVLDDEHQLSPHDADALSSAAEPLLALLATRRQS